MKEFLELRVKTYIYLEKNNFEDEKTKCTKKHISKRKLKLQDCKSCVEEAEIKRKISYLRKNKIGTDSIK